MHEGESSDSKKEAEGVDGHDVEWKMSRSDEEVGRGGDVGST